MDLGFNLAQSNRDLKDLTSRQNFGDTSGLLCKNDLIPCLKGRVEKNWEKAVRLFELKVIFLSNKLERGNSFLNLECPVLLLVKMWF